VGVANDAAFQPVRTGTGGLDTIRNLAVGTTVDGSSLSFSTGDGGFFFGETALTEGTVFNDGHNNWKISYVAETGGLNFATSMPGSHFITLSNLTAIPEPASLLALGCLIGSGAFLRRRR